MKPAAIPDVVDVHVTGESSDISAILQYPLLDGSRQYTVEVTEFCCPIMSESPLPDDAFCATEIGMFFRIHRKNLAGLGVAVNHADTYLTTLFPAGVPAGTVVFTEDNTVFRKNPQRPIRTVGDLAYYMQRFFDDVREQYVNRLGLLPVVALLQGIQHGGIPNVAVAEDDDFVQVEIAANGSLRMLGGEGIGAHYGGGSIDCSVSPGTHRFAGPPSCCERTDCCRRNPRDGRASRFVPGGALF